MNSEPDHLPPQLGASMSPAPAGGNSLDNVTIELNWARNLENSDYLSMEACLACKTAADFFALIESEMPDELQGLNGNGNRIKEIKVKARTPLHGDGGMPRIKRDEKSGRHSLRTLIKRMRSQPPDTEIDLEFLMIWE